MFIQKKQSDWTFKTSAGMSASYEVVGETRAYFILNDPRGGTVKFNYATAGVGLSAGSPVGLGFSDESMMSVGTLFVSDSYPGDDIKASDLEGFCLVTEASLVSSRAGRTATMMLLGIPTAKIPQSLLKDLGVGMALTVGGTVGRALIDDHPVLAALAGPSVLLTTRAGEALAKNHGAALPEFLKSNAKAALFMISDSKGIQGGVGILGSVGYVWIGPSDEPPQAVKNLMPAPVDHYQPNVATTREKIPFPSDVLFDFDKYDIKPDAELALWGLAGKIQQRVPGRIVIEGHTDGKGDPGHNHWLSCQRAKAVRQWLVVRMIVKPANITAVGKGHSEPAFPDTLNGQDNPDGRMRNRRIEVRFLWK